MAHHIGAILWKQMKDTLKNKTILIQFVMFPFMTIVMENVVTIQNMPEHFFTNLFSIMYVGMAPLTGAAAIISEEKEKNTLRVLRMSNVGAAEFLIGNAVYIVSICMAGSLIIGISGGYAGYDLLKFMVIMFVGHCCSFLLGAAVGVASRNQMMATSIGVPVMMVLSFLPMLATFNDTIRNVSKYIFSEQLYLLTNHLQQIKITSETGIIMGCNVAFILIVFFFLYQNFDKSY